MKISTDKSYLVFIDRNHSKSWAFYKPVVGVQAKEKISYKTISEYKGCDFYYNLNNQSWYNQEDDFWNFYTKLELRDIIDRCRVLRSLSGEQARVLIKKALAYCFDFFKAHKVDTLLIFAVDRYTIDVMVRVANLFGVEIIGVGGSFIKGTKRITIYGEPQKVGYVEDQKVEKLYEDLKKSYESSGKPSLSKAYVLGIKTEFSTWGRYLIHYLILHKILGKQNFDYLLVKTQPRIFFYNLLFFRTWVFHIKRIKDFNFNRDTQRVYIPLHFHPEATVDYWTDASYKAYYLDSLCEVISFFRGKNIQVFLKEHPAMYLIRHPNFYKTLRNYSNVKLIWPFIETIEVLKYFDKVVVWTGTTGIESAVNDKNVYIYSKNYWDNGFFKNWKEIDMNSKVSPETIKVILKNFMENLCYE